MKYLGGYVTHIKCRCALSESPKNDWNFRFSTIKGCYNAPQTSEVDLYHNVKAFVEQKNEVSGCFRYCFGNNCGK